MQAPAADCRIGTAGWSVPAAHASAFPAGGSHLGRYGAVFRGVEINSSFYRPHRPATYARWAASVPPDFRFAVKVPRSMTHESRLVDCEALIAPFADQVGALGDRLGPLLVQLPPSLPFEVGTATAFLAALRDRFDTAIVCEPRHAGWLTPEANAVLRDYRVARVAADPPPVPGADEPGGWPGLAYWRWHGRPRVYYTAYAPDALARLAARCARWAADAGPAWVIFDNTALGHAAGDALGLVRLLGTAAAPGPS